MPALNTMSKETASPSGYYQKDFFYSIQCQQRSAYPLKICYIVGMETSFGEEILNITEKKIMEPKRYQVVFLNDDYTTKEFVTDVLQVIFHKNLEEAQQLMELVHKTGSAVVGTYTYDIALTRVNLTIKIARENGFPLRCEMQEI